MIDQLGGLDSLQFFHLGQFFELGLELLIRILLEKEVFGHQILHAVLGVFVGDMGVLVIFSQTHVELGGDGQAEAAALQIEDVAGVVLNLRELRHLT